MVSAENLFQEPGLTQITVWARGVLENKEARDVVVALTEAAAKEKKYVQAWENYVDLPDRIYVPVRAYARISTEPIISKYIYENETPDIVVLTEETLVKGNPILAGLRPGGVLVVNTRRAPLEIAAYLDNLDNLKLIATVDASGMASNTITLSGAEGATDASGIGVGMGAALAAAVVKATGIVKYESIKEVVQNQEALQGGYEKVQIAAAADLAAQLNKTNECREAVATGKHYSASDLSFAGTVPSPQTENTGMITGHWRTRRPILDRDRCTECLQCWIFCPDSCITRTEDGLDYNLKYCKGCGICQAVCKAGAVSMAPELDFKE